MFCAYSCAAGDNCAFDSNRFFALAASASRFKTVPNKLSAAATFKGLPFLKTSSATKAVSKAAAPYKAGLPIKFSAFNNSFGLKFCFKKYSNNSLKLGKVNQSLFSLKKI